MILIVINLCNFNDIKIYSKHTNENKYYYDLNKKISITYNNNKIDIHDIYTFEYLKNY